MVISCSKMCIVSLPLRAMSSHLVDNFSWPRLKQSKFKMSYFFQPIVVRCTPSVAKKSDHPTRDNEQLKNMVSRSSTINLVILNLNIIRNQLLLFFSFIHFILERNFFQFSYFFIFLFCATSFVGIFRVSTRLLVPHMIGRKQGNFCFGLLHLV